MDCQMSGYFAREEGEGKRKKVRQRYWLLEKTPNDSDISWDFVYSLALLALISRLDI